MLQNAAHPTARCGFTRQVGVFSLGRVGVEAGVSSEICLKGSS